MGMTFEDYRMEAARTANTDLDRQDRAVENAVGLASEAGEILGLTKKNQAHGHLVNVEKLAEEIGDTAWHVFDLVTLYGLKGPDSAAPIAAYQAAADADLARWKEREGARWIMLRSVRLARFAGGVAALVESNTKPSGMRIAVPLAGALENVLVELAAIASAYGLSLERCLEGNVAKLWKRYPKGWSPAASVARVDVAPPRRRKEDQAHA